MALYRVKGPDNKYHEFSGPEGMPTDIVNMLANDYFEPERPKPTAPQPKPEYGFIPSVKRGAMQLESLLGDVVPAMAAHAVGAEDYAKKQMQEAAQTQEEIAKKYPEEVASYKDIKDIGTGAKYIVESVGELIPSMLPSLFTGGAASVAGRAAVAAAKEAAEKVVLEKSTGVATKNLLEEATTAGVEAAKRTALKNEAVGALAGSAVQNIPDVYQSVYQDTGKEDLGAALAFGGFNSILDAITPLNLLRKAKLANIPQESIIGAWYKRAGKGALEGLVTEGGTEALQEMSSAAADRYVDQHKDFFTQENFERFINAGLKGGLGGGVATAATNVAFGKAAPTVTTPSTGATPSEQILDKLRTQDQGPTTTPIPEAQPAAPIGETPGFRILEQEEAQIQSPEKVPTLPPQPEPTPAPAAASPEVEKLKEDIEKQKAELTQGVTSKGEPLNQHSKKKKEEKIAKLETKLEEAKDVTQPIAEPTGAGVSVPVGPDTNVAPAGGVGGAEAPGVVSVGENVPSAAPREAEQPTALKEPKPGIVNQLAREEQKKAGWNEDWPFIPADLGNADFRRSIAEDPSISSEDKVKIFEAGKKLGVVPKDEQITEPKPKKLSEMTSEQLKESFTEGEPSGTETPEAVQTKEEGPQEQPTPEPVVEHTQDQIEDYEATREEHNKNNPDRPIPEFDKLTPEQKQAFFDATPNNNGNEQDIAAGQLADQIHGREKPETKPLPQNVATMTQAIEAMRFGKHPFHKAVAQLLRKAKLKTKLQLVSRLDGRLAEYDPKTDTVRAVKEGMNADTLLHEMTHAATVKVIHAYENDLPLTEKQEMAVIHLEYLMDESRKRLSGKYPEAYKNLYEFVAHAMNDEPFVDELKQIPIAKENSIFNIKTNFFTDFIRSIAQALGIIDDQSNFAAEAFRSFEDIIAPPPKGGIEMEPLGMETKQAEKVPDTPEEIVKNAAKQVEIKPSAGKTFIRNILTKSAAHKMTELIQNDRIYIKVAEDKAALRGILDRISDKLNDVNNQLTRSSGMAVDLFNRNAKHLVENLDNAVLNYANKVGKDVVKALEDLHIISEVMHEPERRLEIYTNKVPLDASKTLIEFYGKKYTAYAFRDEAARLIANPAERKKLGASVEELHNGMRKIIDSVQNDVNSPFRAKEILVQKKRGEVEYKPTQASDFDISSLQYNVIAGRDPREIGILRRAYVKPELMPEIDAVLAALDKVQKETRKLNQMAGYESEPVSDLIDYYNFKHYVPFKGKPGKITQAAEDLNFDSVKIGGEHQKVENRMEGRISESENPILQTRADIATAAMRAGRRDLTLSIMNAVNPARRVLQGNIKAKVSFDERFRGGVKIQEMLGQNDILHYDKDGSIYIVEITDKNQMESLRRTYRESSPILDFINNLTSGLGQTHTRYNPSFAPKNFVTDTFTNAFTIGAELGPARAGKLLSFLAGDVASGGLGKSLRYSQLYANSKFDEIKRLAGGDKPYSQLTDKERYYRDLDEYVQMGGKVSYLQGIAVRGALDQLIKEVGRSGILKTKDQIDKFLDVYNDMFELSSRVASYRFLKNEFYRENLAKNMDPAAAEADAKSHAVEKTKNLANFEQVGRWGKQGGALFMFFRPAATGAVRAIEALAPAFQKINEKEFTEQKKAEKWTDEEIKNALVKLKDRQKHARVMATSLVGMGVGVYMMAMMMSGDDDQGRNKVLTDDMARWTRYMRFPIPGTDIIIQIPWGFGLGAFAAVGAQIASMFAGRASWADGLSNIVNIGTDAFLPIPTSKISPTDNFPAWAMDSVTPSLIRPFFEYTMNLNGLGQEIYNNRQTRYGDAYTGGDNIPELYKYAARTLFNATNGEVDWSPNTMYFFANSYFDGMAKTMTGASNLGLTLTGQKQIDLKNDTIFLDSFIGGKSNVDAREFSKVENEIKQIDKRINSIKDKPEMLAKYMEENPQNFYLVEYYNAQVNGTLRQLRAESNKLRVNRELTINERKEKLDEVVKMENVVKRQLLNNFEAISGIKP